MLTASRCPLATRLGGVLWTIAILYISSGISAAEPSQPNLPESVVERINDRTIGIAEALIGEIEPSLRALLVAVAGGPTTDRDKLESSARRWLEELKQAGGRRMYVMVSAGDDLPVPGAAGWGAKFWQACEIVVPDVQPAVAQRLAAQFQARQPESRPLAECRAAGTVLTISAPRRPSRAASLPARPRPEIVASFATLPPAPVRIVICPPPVFARAASDIITADVPGFDISWGRLIGQIRRITLTLTPDQADWRGRFTIALAEVWTAERLQKILPKQLSLDGKNSPGVVSPGESSAPLDWHRDAAMIDLDVTPRVGQIIQRFVAGRLFSATAAGNRQRISNHLKQLMIAMHNYHDAHKHFPATAICDVRGKPLLSWRVAILPFLDADDLYRQFHLDESWDSPHNRPLADQMPDVFRGSDSISERNRTEFLAPVGEHLAFERNRPRSLKEFLDGTSRTIMFVVADHDRSVIWTRPDDIEIDMDYPQRGLEVSDNALQLVAVDGTVHVLTAPVEAKTLRALFTCDGREPVSWP